MLHWIGLKRKLLLNFIEFWWHNVAFVGWDNFMLYRAKCINRFSHFWMGTDKNEERKISFSIIKSLYSAALKLSLLLQFLIFLDCEIFAITAPLCSAIILFNYKQLSETLIFMLLLRRNFNCSDSLNLNKFSSDSLGSE